MLFIAGGEDWKRFRTIMTPTFAHGKVKLMKEMVEHTAESLIKNLKHFVRESKDGVLEVKHIIGAFTMDTIVQIAFGKKIDSLVEPNNPVLVNAKRLLQQNIPVQDVIKYTIILMSPKLAKFLDLRPSYNEVEFFKKFSHQIIQEKRAEFTEALRKGEKVKATNFIELLIEAECECNRVSQNEGKQIKFMTTEEIVAQCVLFFAVGYDTTAMTISMTCYELAKNPKYQALIYDEIQETFKKQKIEAGNENLSMRDAFTMEVLAKMPYLNAALSETLRIHNPVVLIEREASNDITISSEDIEIDIQKNDIVTVPLYCLHHDPKHFPNPDKYDPERFIRERTFPEYAYRKLIL